MRTSTEDKWDLWAFNMAQIDAWLGATALLTIAVEKVLETWDKVAIEHESYPKKFKEDSIKLQEDCHVDDITTEEGAEVDYNTQEAVDLKEVSSSTSPSVSKAMSSKLNTMVSPLSDNFVEAEWLTGNKFGYSWNSKDGLFCLSVKCNPSIKRKGSKAHSDIVIAEINSFKLQSFCKRSLLTMCNNNFVPLDFFSSLIFECKPSMKTKLKVEGPNQRDSPLSSHITNEWSLTIED